MLIWDPVRRNSIHMRAGSLAHARAHAHTPCMSTNMKIIISIQWSNGKMVSTEDDDDDEKKKKQQQHISTHNGATMNHRNAQNPIGKSSGGERRQVK